MRRDHGVVGVGDGREVRFREWGPPDGAPLVYCHGGWGGLLLRHVNGEYERLGLRVVTIERPGFGGSARVAGRRVVDCVPDVIAVADRLGLRSFAVLGVSAGGPYALATAALHPDRVTRCATVVSGPPMRAEDFDGTAYLPAGLQEHWRRMDERGEDYLVQDHAECLDAVYALQHETPPPGTETTHAMWVETFLQAMAPGPWGYVDDWLAERQEWGFDLGRVRVPTRLVVARDDDSVPAAHVARLATLVPAAEVVTVDGGHTGLRQAEEEQLLAWLAGDRRPTRR